MDLHDHIWQCLDLGLLDGALFAAEQSVKLDGSEESLFMHGMVLYRQEKFKSAAFVLNGQKYLPSAYLFAQCCLKINKAENGIRALNVAKPWAPIAGRRGCPSLAAINLVMGKLFRDISDREGAATAFATSAKEDPYLFENVAGLVELNGFKVDVQPLFREQQIPTVSSIVPQSPGLARTPFVSRRVSLGLTTPLRAPTAALQNHETPLQPPTNLQYLRNITPTPLKSPENLQLAPRRRAKVKRHLPMGGDDSFLRPSNFEEPKPRAASGFLVPDSLPAGADGATPQQIYMIYFEAYRFLCKYEGRQCLARIEQLPEALRRSASVLALTARAHYELLDYLKATEVFEQLRQVDPFRTQDMEKYSASLWQLKKQAELGFLAHELTVADRDAWQTWCVMGNSFSCQQDIAKAIECFSRAVSLNPECAVAWGLQGHEHLLNEEYQTAIDCFRTALKFDTSHYNSWLGLAMTLFRLEMFDQAERYISMAIRINPNNAVMLCFAGVLAHHKGSEQAAFSFFERAKALQPEFMPARYQLACHLLESGQLSYAEAEFEWLQDRDPSDAEITFQLGCVYHRLRKRQLALQCFTAAVALDSKLSGKVKQILEGN